MSKKNLQAKRENTLRKARLARHSTQLTVTSPAPNDWPGVSCGILIIVLQFGMDLCWVLTSVVMFLVAQLLRSDYEDDLVYHHIGDMLVVHYSVKWDHNTVWLWRIHSVPDMFLWLLYQYCES